MQSKFGWMGLTALLVACSTPQYKTERNICQAEWMQKIPPIYKQELYNKSMSRQVPTGRSICQSYGRTTECVQQMKTEFYEVPAVRTVDINSAKRNVQINACTQNICLQKYGNTEVKFNK